MSLTEQVNGRRTSRLRSRGGTFAEELVWKLGAGGKKPNHDNWKRTSAGKIELNSRAVHAFGACCWIRFIYMWSIYLADLKIPAALAWRGGGITQTHAQCASLSRSRSVLCLYLHVVCSMFSLWWLCDGGGVVLSASPGLTSRPSPLAPRPPTFAPRPSPRPLPLPLQSQPLEGKFRELLDYQY